MDYFGLFLIRIDCSTEKSLGITNKRVFNVSIWISLRAWLQIHLYCNKEGTIKASVAQSKDLNRKSSGLIENHSGSTKCSPLKRAIGNRSYVNLDSGCPGNLTDASSTSSWQGALCVLHVYYRHFNFAQILHCALDNFWGLVFLHIVLRSFLTQAKSPSQVGISRVFSVFNLSVFI